MIRCTKGQSQLLLLIVKGNTPKILGKKFVEKGTTGLERNIAFVGDEVPLKLFFLGGFESVFSEELGCSKHFKVKLPVDRTTNSLFL